MTRARFALLATLLVAVAACAADEPTVTGDPQPEPDVVQAEASADTFDATIGLAGDHAIVARLVVDLDSPGTPEVTITGTERNFTIPVADEAMHHEIPVAGLRAESSYEIEVTVGDNTVSLPLETGPLPDEIPELTIATSDPEAMSPGFTLFDLIDFTQPETDEDGNPIPVPEPDGPPLRGIVVAVDAEGEVVWYHLAEQAIGDVRMLPDGTIFHENDNAGARIIDLYGNTLHEWATDLVLEDLSVDGFGRQVVGDDAIVVATDSMHHEQIQLSNGNFATLSTELHTFDGFSEPLCDDHGTGSFSAFDGTYDLISDVLVEFTPEGEIVFEVDLADLFDPVNDPRDQNLCGLPNPDGFPNRFYRARGFDDARDWTHSNAIIEDAERNAFIVSVRHLDAIIAVSRDTGELLWRLGPDGDFTMVGDGEFPFHPHAPELQDDGTLLLYDNGNDRPGTSFEFGSGLPFPTSRAVLYELDDSGPPDTWTVEQLWEYESRVDGVTAFAGFVGDADRLENGNVLITNGGYGQDRDDRISAQIVEVVPEGTDGGTEVFDLRVQTGEGWVIYRAERLPTFYPAG